MNDARTASSKSAAFKSRSRKVEKPEGRQEVKKEPAEQQEKAGEKIIAGSQGTEKIWERLLKETAKSRSGHAPCVPFQTSSQNELKWSV